MFSNLFIRLLTYKRRASLGIKKADIVLDVGSGHRPHQRTDILCEKYLEGIPSRDGRRAKIDRPLVVGDITALPFLNSSIDYIICSHVLEHIEKVEVALSELTRVGKRGYIETPSPLWEKLMCRPFHIWLVKKDSDGKLCFNHKEQPLLNSDILEFFWCIERKSKAWNKVMLENFNLFYTTLEWETKIPFVVNRKRKFDNHLFEDLNSPSNLLYQKDLAKSPWMKENFIEQIIKSTAKYLHRKSKYPRRSINIFNMLACPKCKNKVALTEENDWIFCKTCGLKYPLLEGIPMMLIEHAKKI